MENDKQDKGEVDEMQLIEDALKRIAEQNHSIMVGYEIIAQMIFWGVVFRRTAGSNPGIVAFVEEATRQLANAQDIEHSHPVTVH